MASYFSGQAILIELDALKKKLASSRTIFKPDSQKIISLEKRINAVSKIAKQSQLNAVNAGINDIKIKIDELNKKQKKVLTQNKKLPDFINEFNKLNQDLELAEENYISFTKTKEKFRLGIAQNNFPWQIINPPSVEENQLNQI